MCTDSQEVGLEAATLERKRNSSLVKCVCAENVAGLKQTTEAMDVSSGDVVGERSLCGEADSEGKVEGSEVKMPA